MPARERTGGVNLAFFVNEMAAEKDYYSTTRLARAAVELGHEVFYVGAGDLSFGPGGEVKGHMRRAPSDPRDSLEDFFEPIAEGEPSELDVREMDALMLRNDPSDDLQERPWAANAGIAFGHLIGGIGVRVVNDPAGLAKAANKLYLHEFPPEVIPATLISRDTDRIKGFVDSLDGRAVLKPLFGAKGEKVFFLDGDDDPNINQMMEAILEEGYVVAQEYIPEAEDGDVRIFLVNGEPLQHNGRYAAFRRRPASDDMRSNMSSGGTAEAAEVGEDELRIAEAIGDRLRSDGMFLAGLDIVGNKLVEVNVESPGGLKSVQDFTGIDFAPVIVKALEEKTSGRSS